MTFVIPARAGSQRLPLKNFSMLGGFPLFAWSVSFALRAMPASKVLLSTDFRPLLDFEHGIENLHIVPRSKIVSSSEASTEDWLLSLKADGHIASHSIALLQPTSPFRANQTFTQLLRKHRLKPSVPHYSGIDGRPNGNLYLFSLDNVSGGRKIVRDEAECLEPIFDWENVDIDDASDWREAEAFLAYPSIQELRDELVSSEFGRSLEGFALR